MQQFRQGSEWVLENGLSPELAQLDHEEWLLHPWRYRTKMAGRLVLEALEATGMAMYPQCAAPPDITPRQSPREQ